MSRTIEQTISFYEKMIKNAEWSAKLLEKQGDYSTASELREDAKFRKQITEWLRELQERRKEPEIVRCGECVNFAERDFCKVAGHNVHRKSNCMQVFGAERRTE